MSFRDAIENIVVKIPPGYTFDSHYVITQLIRTYSDEYIRFVARFSKSAKPTFTAHQQIGLEIAKLAKAEHPLVRQETAYKSWSENIHGTQSECTLWIRL